MIEPESIAFIHIDLAHLNINYHSLIEDEIRLLEKLQNSSIETNVFSILNVDTSYLSNQSILGSRGLKILQKLQNRILIDLAKIDNKLSSLDEKCNMLFISSISKHVKMREVDEFLHDGLKKFLMKLDKIEKDIATSTWGVNKNVVPIDIIAIRTNLSSMKIKFLKAKLQRRLPHYLELHPVIISKSIRNKLYDVFLQLPKTASLFVSHTAFISFLELCCQYEKGYLANILFPEVEDNLLSSLFCKYSSPIEYLVLIKKMKQELELDVKSAKKILAALEWSGAITINNKKVSPLNLSKAEATAHILLNYPSGLRKQEIADTIISRNICSTKINLDMKNNDFDSKHIYMCNKDQYRHIKYSTLNKLSIKNLLEDILFYLQQNEIECIKLYEYCMNKNESIDFYIIRYIIKYYGKNCGIYLFEQCGVDVISLSPQSISMRQQDLIFNVIKNAIFPLTLKEILRNLNSQDAQMVQSNLVKLIRDRKIISVGKIKYTIANINLIPKINRYQNENKPSPKKNFLKKPKANLATKVKNVEVLISKKLEIFSTYNLLELSEHEKPRARLNLKILALIISGLGTNKIADRLDVPLNYVHFMKNFIVYYLGKNRRLIVNKFLEKIKEF